MDVDAPPFALQAPPGTAAAAAFEPRPDDADRLANKAKFELELEMLCTLANPHYLHELAASGFLDDGAPFLAFVDYLAYWEQPAFAKYIIYPQALHHRRLLLQPGFRSALRIQGVSLVQKLADVQFQHWRTWRSEKQQQPPAAAEPAV